jgi:hypothetical protein
VSSTAATFGVERGVDHRWRRAAANARAGNEHPPRRVWTHSDATVAASISDAVTHELRPVAHDDSFRAHDAPSGAIDPLSSPHISARST